jgi:hypothetical protein
MLTSDYIDKHIPCVTFVNLSIFLIKRLHLYYSTWSVTFVN